MIVQIKTWKNMIFYIHNDNKFCKKMLFIKYYIPRHPKTDMYSKSLVPQKNNYFVAVNTASNECIISIDLNFSTGGNIVEDSKISNLCFSL